VDSHALSDPQDPFVARSSPLTFNEAFKPKLAIATGAKKLKISRKNINFAPSSATKPQTPDIQLALKEEEQDEMPS